MKLSQTEQIKRYLLRGKSLTPLGALDRFDCFRLSARIKNIRDEGLDIKSKRVTTRSGKSVSSYWWDATKTLTWAENQGSIANLKLRKLNS